MRADERRYYDRRAPEYDDWYLGRGLFAEVERPGWEDEARRVADVLRKLPPGRILDVACGTGFLTEHLRGAVTGIDQSEAMLEIARRRCPGCTFLVGDGLALPFEDGSFDLLFTSFFYGHLRAHDRERFRAEARRVAPGLAVVDAAVRPGIEPEGMQERLLNDGSRHRVYKRYFDPEELAAELGGGRVLLAGDWFVAVAA